MTFTEKQHFTQIWAWLILIGIFISSLFPIFKKQSISILTIIIYTAPILLMMILFALMHLQTTINKSGIIINFYPFHRKPKVFNWEDIERIELLKYSPLFEYGGWGIRGLGDDKAYNIRGNMGLKIFLKNKNKIVIGTQKTDELRTFIEKLIQQKEIHFQDKTK